MEFSFGKEYKLCSKKEIDALFGNGKRIRVFPFQLIYAETETVHPKRFQVLMAVPKKNVRKAHNRNYIKRCMREIIRLNKQLIENPLSSSNKNMNLAIVYGQREIENYHQLEPKLVSLLKKFNHLPEFKTNEA